MATYKQIQEYVRCNHQFTPKTCWIAHVKELHGINTRTAPNRLSEDTRKYPCPEGKRVAIEEAMQFYGMI